MNPNQARVDRVQRNSEQLERMRREGLDVYGQPLPTGKVCTKCHEEKPLEDFPANKKIQSGRSSWCRACHRAATRAWYGRRLRA